MRKQFLWIAAVAVATCFAGAGLASDADNSGGGEQACMEKAYAAGEDFRSTVQENSKCRTDAECEVVPVLLCPLGCYAAVAKANAQKIRDLVKEISGELECECKYKCPPLPKHASCKKGHCTITR